ncbi:hypothetical protein QN347_03775 [Sphingomonas sp. 10B4]|nr:hypothetical protein [Sphingomonas sp. 10B4]
MSKFGRSLPTDRGRQPWTTITMPLSYIAAFMVCQQGSLKSSDRHARIRSKTETIDFANTTSWGQSSQPAAV